MNQIKDLEPGTEVIIRLLVIEQNPGQTLCLSDGVGESGLWSIVNSVAVESVEGSVTPDMLNLMLSKIDHEKARTVLARRRG